jgi:hypothetical protein
MINLKKPFLFSVLAMSTLFSIAQKKHFIYIQSEDKQPFYVMMQNKNYSSTLSGYLVIPKLKNGRYFFTAGFPKNIYPEQHFTCVINDSDLGFSLKRFGNQGWGLFNYVSFATIMANPTDWEKDKMNYDTVKINMEDLAISQNPAKNHSNNEVEQNKSSSLISKNSEANTKTTPENSLTKKTEAEVGMINLSKETIAVIAVSSSTEEANNQAKSTPIKNTTSELAQVNNNAEGASFVKNTDGKSGITKTFQKLNEYGIDQVYIDYSVTKTDTITLFIPYAGIATIDINNGDTSRPGSTSTSQYNRSCVNLATEADYGKIRRLMSAETTDDKMVQLAKSMFKNRCFTTEQIKKLGLLFISEQSRLKFFQVAKSFIYDVFNYASLETEFTIPSVIELFRKTANN